MRPQHDFGHLGSRRRGASYGDLRRRRLALWLTQQEIADTLGVSKMSISLVERGMGVKRGRVVRDLAEYLFQLEAEQS